MTLIKNIIIIDLKSGDGSALLLNGINGSITKIGKEERDIIERWVIGPITPVSSKEHTVFRYLMDNQFIMDIDSEMQIKNRVISKLKAKINHNDKSSTKAWFILSYNCNFDCPYCYERGLSNKKILTKEMVDQVFEQNPGIDRIGFFGGEPFLPSHKEIIMYIISKAPSANFCAITNGYNLHEYIPILRDLNVSYIQVTLDGSEANHNRTRHTRGGQPTYQKIIAGIIECTQFNIPVTIRMNISEANKVDCLSEMARIKKTEWGKKVQFELQPLFQYSCSERMELQKALFAEEAHPKENKIFHKMLPLANFLYHGTRLVPILRACDAEQKNRFYDPDGNIYNCILAVGNQYKSIGSYYPTQQFKDKSFLTRDITTIEICKSCKYSLFCGGGCPNALPEDCDIYSPNCTSLVSELETLIPLICQKEGYNLE